MIRRVFPFVAELSKAAAIRLTGLLFLYASISTLSLWLAYAVRFDSLFGPIVADAFGLNWAWALAVKIVCLALFGQFSTLLSFISISDMRRMVAASASASVVFLLVRFVAPEPIWIPRGVVLVDFLTMSAGLGIFRIACRVLREEETARRISHSGNFKRVAIIGAGEAGANLVKELLAKRGLGLQPVFLLDDDRLKWRLTLHGLPVIGPPERLLDRDPNVQLDKVIIAMPSAHPKRMREIIKILQQSRLEYETIASMGRVAAGAIKVTELRHIDIEDLIDHEPVVINQERVKEFIKLKTVLVTGAGGEIGSELCRQIVAAGPRQLILLDQSEVSLFQIEQDIITRGFSHLIVPVIADILDLPRLRSIFQQYKPELVFHAAAYKSARLMDDQPGEAVKTNVLGAINAAEIAAANGAQKFMLLSTDEASSPTSVVGKTKRWAEIFLASLAGTAPAKTKFASVRFGEVLGSSDGMVWNLKSQIIKGGPVIIPGQNSVASLLTLSEAAGLILEAASIAQGGEIFSLDMGEPIKLTVIADRLMQLGGLHPGRDIEVQVAPANGAARRSALENPIPTSSPKIRQIRDGTFDPAAIQKTIEDLRRAANYPNPEAFSNLLGAPDPVLPLVESAT